MSTHLEPLASPLRLDVDGTLTLAELTESLNDICRQAERSARVVVVLSLSETGRRAWPGDAAIQDVNQWERAIRRFERLASASIAVADGTCGGPALDLLLPTDYRIVASDFRLVLHHEDGQFWPGMAVYRLANQVGIARARQMLLSGEISAQRALDVGLIDEIADITDDVMRATVAKLGRVSGAEVAIRRQLLLEAPGTSFDEARGAHLAACDREMRRVRERVMPDAKRPARVPDAKRPARASPR